jgi:hypothetical protein
MFAQFEHVVAKFIPNIGQISYGYDFAPSPYIMDEVSTHE